MSEVTYISSTTPPEYKKDNFFLSRRVGATVKTGAGTPWTRAVISKLAPRSSGTTAVQTSSFFFLFFPVFFFFFGPQGHVGQFWPF